MPTSRVLQNQPRANRRRPVVVLALAALVALGPVALGAGCARTSSRDEVSEADVLARFEEMHRAVYGLYRLGPDRDAVHALLAASFDGEALTREYVEHFTTLSRMAQENIGIDVRRVDYESLELLERRAGELRVAADWSVGGVVRHQDHRHPRINRYRAIYTLRPTAPEAGVAALRIVDTRLRSLDRVRSAFDNGGAFPLDDLPESAGGLLSTRDLLESGIADELLEEPPATSAQEPP